jgi:hypothetical protein
MLDESFSWTDLYIRMYVGFICCPLCLTFSIMNLMSQLLGKSVLVQTFRNIFLTHILKLLEKYRYSLNVTIMVSV